ncbi:DUF881 domain-containing protein [Aeromicrobium sp. CTD01-1L150]|uniref:DUF881 domain-containing protein n=1 Tax=Aeromicrobium sp. CTD01-1L150 TaxID=3341830 RepID=UPI0035BFB4C2
MGTEGSQRRPGTRLSLLLVCLAAGVMFVAAAATSDGSDLRPTGEDLRSVVQDRAEQVEEQRSEARRLGQEIEELSGQAASEGALDEARQRIASLGQLAGLEPVVGPGVRVTLRDAPGGVRPDDVDPNVLVVHEQDIRAFMNALWSGGAEALTLQGQRIVSTSSITCVGSTVVIDGVPYAPPYEIEAVGEVSAMSFSLSTSPQVSNYKRYAEMYGLGLDIRSVEELSLPAHDGSIGLAHATALRQDPVARED